MHRVIIERDDPLLLIWRGQQDNRKVHYGVVADLDGMLHVGVARGRDAGAMDELSRADTPQIREVLAGWGQRRWRGRVAVDEVVRVSWTSSSGSITFELQDGAEREWHLQHSREAASVGAALAEYVAPSARTTRRRRPARAEGEVRRLLPLVGWACLVVTTLHGVSRLIHRSRVQSWEADQVRAEEFRAAREAAQQAVVEEHDLVLPVPTNGLFTSVFSKPRPEADLLFERVPAVWTLLLSVVLVALVWVVLEVAGRPTVVTSRTRPPRSRDEVTRDRARLALRSR